MEWKEEGKASVIVCSTPQRDRVVLQVVAGMSIWPLTDFRMASLTQSRVQKSMILAIVSSNVCSLRMRSSFRLLRILVVEDGV